MQGLINHTPEFTYRAVSRPRLTATDDQRQRPFFFSKHSKIIDFY